MAVKYVLFVHGYSEQSLGAYFDFPRLLSAATGLTIEEIVLSAFNSLDDSISVSDLADALEDHVANLESKRNWDVKQAAVICHSTGAMVARRWMLDRVLAGSANVPSHLLTIAGANHGSSLAQVGKTVLGFLETVLLKHVLTVGRRVLVDLDYGSDFALKMNREWLEAVNTGGLSRLYAFSMGGDTPGPSKVNDLIWQLHEPGCDNTVRISGANLNYAMVDAFPDENPPVFKISQPRQPVAHLVLSGYSHYGPETGILGNVHALTDPPIAAAVQALSVTSDADYKTVYDDWTARTVKWTQNNALLANSTLVFSLFDRGGRPIDDCFIGIFDQGKAANAVDAMNSASHCVLPHSPIQNDAERGSYSFYLNYKAYLDSSPHVYHIEARSGSDLVGYTPIDYVVESSTDLQHLISPNEFTYVRVEMPRNTDNTYALYRWDPTLALSTLHWMPFPDTGRIPLPPRP